MIDIDKIFRILNKKPFPIILNNIFKKHNFEIRFVGGCIRDAILGLEEIHDIDFASNAKPEEMQDILEKNNVYYYNSGIKHGTITAVFEKISYEITTLRKDLNHDGRHAEVSFDASWEEDAKRRDFTFNAFYLDFNKNFYDYFNGLDDLLKKKIRFIGSIEDRIKEDYLRILRAVRFFNRYCDYGLEDNSTNCFFIRKLANKINNLSGERIFSEILKIFTDTKNQKNINNLNYFNSLNLVEFIFLEKKIIKFEIFNFLNQNLLFEKITGQIKISLFLRENNFNIENLKKRWSLSNKDFLHFKKIKNFSYNFDDFLKNPKKYFFLNYEIILEMIIIICFENILTTNFNVFYDLINFEIFSDTKKNNSLLFFVENIHKIQKPQFPITPKNLILIGYEGNNIGKKLKELEGIWLENNCNDKALNDYIN